MKLSRFKTFTTSYYFPINLTKDQYYMYGLYSAYGGRLSKIYWALFRKSKWIRRLTAIDEKHLDFPYALIKEVEENNSMMSFNMGSPGEEQKISILGYDPIKHQPFFVKFAQKEAAKELSRNEIHILSTLKETGLAPALMNHRVTDDFVFLKTECIKGKRPKSMLLTKEIVDISIRISHLHLTKQTENQEGLLLSMSHGDFCPWNFLENEGRLRLIDWEMAEDRLLGYDLFTYIFHTAFLFGQDNHLKILDESNQLVNYYFETTGVKNYMPYLRRFAQDKSLSENKKGNNEFSAFYQLLLKSI